MLWVSTPKTQDLGNKSSALWKVSEMTLPHSSLERCCAPKHIKAAHTAPCYSHWWTQWGQTPPRDFPHPAELSFCPAVLPRVWYCKLQPRVSTVGPSSTDNQHLSHAEPRVITRKGAQGIPQAADYRRNIGHSSRFSSWEIQNCKLWEPTWQNLGKVLAAAHLTALPGSFHWAAPGLCRPLYPWDHHSPPGSSNTSGFCLSYMRKKMFLFYLMRRFHTPKEYSQDNYYLWSINAGKARIVSEIQTSACVFYRSNLPFRLERYTGLNT